ncbi:MAG: LysM peptidoglycan-binding domain-containing protein, partial [Vicinamibacteria bacterium]
MTTRASRTVSRRPFSPTRSLAFIGLAIVLAGSPARVDAAQEPQPEGAAGEPGEIAIPPHWSPYQAPTSYPEGTRIHIIVRGDTLWDISNTYFQNPFLWPQLWDANRYIENPHLIYPGDPLRIPDLDVLRAEGEEPGAAGPGGRPGEPGAGEEP